MEIIDAVETNGHNLNRWLIGYKTKGLKTFDIKPYVKNKKQIEIVKKRKERVVRLLNATPKANGLNRTSWSITALTLVYNKLYSPAVTHGQMCWCVHRMGYR